MKVFACTAPYGIGGLGQILSQIVEDARLRGDLHKYYTTQPKSGDTIGELISFRV